MKRALLGLLLLSPAYASHLVQLKSGLLDATNTISVTFDNPTVAGNTIVLVSLRANAGFSDPPTSGSDTQGNSYTNATCTNSWSGIGGNSKIMCTAISQGIVGGADTVTHNFANPGGNGGSILIIAEYAGPIATPLDGVTFAPANHAVSGPTTTQALTITCNAGTIAPTVNASNVDAAGFGSQLFGLKTGATSDLTIVATFSNSATLFATMSLTPAANWVQEARVTGSLNGGFYTAYWFDQFPGETNGKMMPFVASR